MASVSILAKLAQILDDPTKKLILKSTVAGELILYFTYDDPLYGRQNKTARFYSGQKLDLKTLAPSSVLGKSNDLRSRLISKDLIFVD